MQQLCVHQHEHACNLQIINCLQCIVATITLALHTYTMNTRSTKNEIMLGPYAHTVSKVSPEPHSFWS